MSVQGNSIRLFLVDGTSGGLTVAEIVNWTGQIGSTPRADLTKGHMCYPEARLIPIAQSARRIRLGDVYSTTQTGLKGDI